MGREFDASGNYLFNDYLLMNVGLGHFSPGTLMVKNAQGVPGDDFCFRSPLFEEAAGLDH
jgi:hypothetical protein